MSSQSSGHGPLSEAAADFERELARYEKISNELMRTTVRSQKTLSRTQKLLGESAECEDALGARLRALLEAMNGARDTQQACMEKTLAAARNLQTRAGEFTALLERVSALGARARDTSEPAIQALTESAKGEQSSGLMGSLEELGDKMLGIVKEAEAIEQDAASGDWPDISRDVQSLKQQVIAAHGKIVQATGTVGSRLLS
jgi:hypothetical protein